MSSLSPACPQIPTLPSFAMTTTTAPVLSCLHLAAAPRAARRLLPQRRALIPGVTACLVLTAGVCLPVAAQETAVSPDAPRATAVAPRAVLLETPNATRSPSRASRNARPVAAVSPVRQGGPLSLYNGQVLVLDQPNVARVAIGNGSLLSATVVADKQIVLLGEGAGTTTMYVWLRSGAQVSYEVTVNGNNLSKTTRELNQLLADYPGIRARSVGDRVVIDGAYVDQEAQEKVDKIAKAYPQVLNLIRQRPQELAVYPDQMVQLDVKVVEVRKQALDNIGVKWSNLGIAGPTFATSGYFYANSPFRGTAQGAFPTTTSARPFIAYLGLATQITSVLNFLESNGDSLTLA
ncbi:MAG: hypothetical protein EOO25_19685, partial [Comamonadaceae bacterium]